MNTYKKLFAYVPEDRTKAQLAIIFSVVSSLITCTGIIMFLRCLKAYSLRSLPFQLFAPTLVLA